MEIAQYGRAKRKKGELHMGTRQTGLLRLAASAVVVLSLCTGTCAHAMPMDVAGKPQTQDETAAHGVDNHSPAGDSDDGVSSTTSSDKPDLFYWGEKVSYGDGSDEVAVFFDPRFWPTKELMNDDIVDGLLADSGATPAQQEILRTSAHSLQLLAAGKAVFVAAVTLLGLAGAYAVGNGLLPQLPALQLPQLPALQLPFE
ncbi:hypothetical protein J7S19_07775 [Corynebacterium pyruviciproducens]|uniref:hypothetical protein n=1 Tax=Corynebacterium pyruviciproducens TaxID=598660 RepID=UPI002453B74E|nr:hypothetical protein [Corynebacterium pyruviciproducens]MDH4658500.1 hypothetical protein [Corynebacterium pyruviciproducens]